MLSLGYNDLVDANEITSNQSFLLCPRPALEFAFQLECLVSGLDLPLPDEREGSTGGRVSAKCSVDVLRVAELEILCHTDI